VGPSFLLASHSPRRRELLAAAGFEFQAVSADVAEKFDVDLTLRELTLLNALRKGMAVARLHPDAIVLAADTLVALDGEVIGKPRDLRHAEQVLRRLSGRVHEVCSAVFIQKLSRARHGESVRWRTRSTSFCEVSRVRFRRLSKNRIDSYFAKVNPLDKAGAYAAQGCGADIIAHVEGSFTNVVGLPMERTIRALADFGITPATR
jgi:septum formation protein